MSEQSAKEMGLNPEKIKELVKIMGVDMANRPEPVSLKKDIIQPTKFEVIQSTADELTFLFIFSLKDNKIEEELEHRNILEVDEIGYEILDIGIYRGVKTKKGVPREDFRAVQGRVIPNYVPVKSRNFQTVANQMRNFLGGHPIGNSLLREMVESVEEMEHDASMMEKFIKSKNSVKEYKKFKAEEEKRMVKEAEEAEMVEKENFSI